MKRSTQIGLAAVGVVLAAGAMNMRQEGQSESLVYNSRADCRAGGILTSVQCDERFAEASRQHLREARKFPSTAACEAQYGSGGCATETWNGAQVIVPALTGIMMARYLSGATGSPQALLPPTRTQCPPGSPAEGCQQARSSSGSSGSFGGSSSRRSRAYSSTSGAAVLTRDVSSSGVMRSTSVASRGGFGSTSRSFVSRASS